MRRARSNITNPTGDRRSFFIRGSLMMNSTLFTVHGLFTTYYIDNPRQKTTVNSVKGFNEKKFFSFLNEYKK